MSTWSDGLSNLAGRLKGALSPFGAAVPPTPPAAVEKAGYPIEGEYRPGPYKTDDGWIPEIAGRVLNWWQLGYSKRNIGENATVEACVAAYAQTIAMLPGRHVRHLDNGGTEDVKNSALSRILRKPNGYQTKSDFMLNLVRGALYQGNAYAVAIRNDRQEIDSLHLLPSKSTRARIVPETGDVFYECGGNQILDTMLDPDRRWMIPARDVLHIRFQHREGNPFHGISLIEAAGLAQYQSAAISRSATNFFDNLSRPSGVISTDMTLTAIQVKELRERWNEQSAGLNAGGVPILTSGLKWQSMGLSAVDGQVIQQLQWTSTEICKVLRVPGAMVNDMTGATWNNVEALMEFWLASGLGFLLEHIEEAFDTLFGLDAKLAENTEFQTDALLRSQFASRIDALAKGIQGGLFTPNEARRMEELPSVGKSGDMPRVQQQLVPLDFDPTESAMKIAAAKPAPAPPAANGNEPAPAPPAAKPAASKAEISYRIRAAIDARLRA